jgi:hypothetical protein
MAGKQSRRSEVSPVPVAGESAAWRGVCISPAEHRLGSASFRYPREPFMFGFYSSRLGCLGSLAVSIVGSIILIVAMRSCAM